MRGASLADLHLGFRSGSDTTDGRNTREVDTELAWERAVDAILAAGVDVVTIAGDVFHHPRVSDYAKRAFLHGVRRLIDAEIIVVVLQGNHDAGRTSDVLTPIRLAEGMGEYLHIVTEPTRIERIILGAGKVSFACFPYVSRQDLPAYKLDPDPDSDVNILAMHAAVKGSDEGDRLPYFYGNERVLDIAREADTWDVVALGDYHEYTDLAPMAFYSGSLERTSSNIWAETRPKGWVLWDTETKMLSFHEIPTRTMIDLGLSDFNLKSPIDAASINNCLQFIAERDDIDRTLLRLKVPDFPRHEREHLDWKTVRALRSRCVHFHLDIDYEKMDVADMGDRRDKAGLSLADEAVAFSEDDAPEVRGLFLSYLDVEAEAEEVDT